MIICDTGWIQSVDDSMVWHKGSVNPSSHHSRVSFSCILRQLSFNQQFICWFILQFQSLPCIENQMLNSSHPDKVRLSFVTWLAVQFVNAKDIQLLPTRTIYIPSPHPYNSTLYDTPSSQKYWMCIFLLRILKKCPTTTARELLPTMSSIHFGITHDNLHSRAFAACP
jgi:hypothetical protein